MSASLRCAKGNYASLRISELRAARFVGIGCENFVIFMVFIQK